MPVLLTDGRDIEDNRKGGPVARMRFWGLPDGPDFDLAMGSLQGEHRPDRPEQRKDGEPKFAR